MPSELKVKENGQIRFFVTGSFSPADSGTDYSRGTPTDVVLTLAGVADDAARQSTKVDLGATRPRAYTVLGCVDFTGETPTTGEPVEYWWAPSTSATQANGNVAGNSGADADAPGGAVPSGLTLAEFLSMCHFIGTLRLSDDGAVQNGTVSARWESPSRYGQLVVVNRGGAAFENDDVEMHQIFEPILDESQ